MLTRGMVFRFTDRPKEPAYRIIEISDNTISIIPMEGSSKIMPLHKNLDEYESLYENGLIIKVEDPFIKKLRSFSPTDRQIKIRDQRWEIFKKYWQDPDYKKRLLYGKKRVSLLKEIAEQLDLKIDQTKRLFTQFLRGGCTKNSLYDKYGQGKCKKPRGEKPGPKTSLQGRRMSEKDIENAVKAYRKYFLGKKYSLKETYRRFLKDYYSYASYDSSGKILYKVGEPEKLITYTQFWHSIKPYRDKKEELEKREGKYTYRNNFSLNTGTALEEALAPGSVYELDSMVCPLYLVTDTKEPQLLGKPILYWSIDILTGMPTGWYLGLSHESRYTTNMVILSMATNKVDESANNGVDCEESEWPAHYLPRNLRGDNGKYKNVNLEALSNFGVKPSFAPGYISKYKGFIEQQHNKLEKLILDHLPGAEMKNPSKSKRKLPDLPDSKKEACMTLKQFRKLVNEVIIILNHIEIVNYPQDPDMISEGLLATPVNLWEWYIKKDRSQIREVSKSELDYLKIQLLPFVDGKTRVVTENGIRFENLLYIPKGSDSRHFAENNIGKSFEVHYDPYLADSVLVDSGDKIYEFKLHPKFKKFRGMAFIEIKAINKKKRNNREQQMADQQTRYIELYDSLDKASSESKKVKKGKRTGSTKPKKMRQNRAAEVLKEEKEKRCSKTEEESVNIKSSIKNNRKSINEKIEESLKGRKYGRS